MAVPFQSVEIVIKIVDLLDGRTYNGLYSKTSAQRTVTEELFNKAIAGPGVEDMPMPLSGATILQRNQAWDEFKNAHKEIERILEPKNKPGYSPWHTVKVNLKMADRGTKLLKVMKDQQKFLAEAVKSDEKKFLQLQNRTIIQHFRSQIPKEADATPPPYSKKDMIYITDGPAKVGEHAEKIGEHAENIVGEHSQVGDVEINCRPEILPTSQLDTSLQHGSDGQSQGATSGDRAGTTMSHEKADVHGPQPSTTNASVPIRVPAHDHQPFEHVESSEAVPTALRVQSTQDSIAKVSPQVIRRSNELTTLNASNCSCPSIDSGMVSLADSALVNFREVANTAATTASSALSPAAIGLGGGTLGLALLKLIEDFEIARRKQNTDDKNSKTLQQTADTNDRRLKLDTQKLNLDFENTLIANRAAHAAEQKLAIDKINAEAARINAYAALLTATTNREQALWEMNSRKKSQGGSGHFDDHDSEDDERRPDFGRDAGTSATSGACLRPVTTALDSTPTASQLDKGKQKATDGASNTSNPISITRTAFNKAAPVSFAAKHIASNSTPTPPVHHSSSVHMPLQPLSLSEEERLMADLEMLSSFRNSINTSSPMPFRKNMENYLACQEATKIQSAKTERRLGKLREDFLRTISVKSGPESVSPEATTPQALQADTASPKETPGQGDEYADPSDQQDFWKDSSAEWDEGEEAHFSYEQTRRESFLMQTLDAIPGNGEGPSRPVQREQVVEGADIISPLAAARLKR